MDPGHSLSTRLAVDDGRAKDSCTCDKGGWGGGDIWHDGVGSGAVCGCSLAFPLHHWYPRDCLRRLRSGLVVKERSTSNLIHQMGNLSGSSSRIGTYRAPVSLQITSDHHPETNTSRKDPPPPPQPILCPRSGVWAVLNGRKLVGLENWREKVE